MVHRGAYTVVSSRSYWSIVGSLTVLVFFAMLALAFYHGVFTGYAGLSLAPETLVAGERVRGTVAYELGDDVLPYESEVTLAVNGYEKTLPLSQLLDPPVAALRSPVVFSPLLKVIVHIREIPSSFGSSLPTAAEAGSNQGVDPGAGPVLIGGAVSSLDSYKTYYVRAGEPVSDTVSQRSELSVSEVRRAGSDELLESSVVSLHQTGLTVSLSTSYTESVSGFVSGNGLTVIALPLDRFSFTLPKRIASPARVAVSFIYRNDLFATLNEEVPILRFFERVAPPAEAGQTASPDHTILPSDSEQTSRPGKPATCTNPICTHFGVCAIPSLGSHEASFLPSSYIRTRQCFCEEGQSYYEETSCRPPEITRVAIVSGILGGRASVLPERVASPPHVSSASSFRWRSTYSVSASSFAFTGGIIRSLGSEERLMLPLAGTVHSLGVVELDTAHAPPRVVIELASTPRRFSLEQGTTYAFDANEDGVNDAAVTFVSVSRGRAVLRIAPFDTASFSAVLGEGDRAATLLTSPAEVPVAHVLLNDALPSVRVFFIQSSYSLPLWCFNSIQDPQETGVDCGGGCRICAQESKPYGLFLSWAALVAFLSILFFLSRRPS